MSTPPNKPDGGNPPPPGDPPPPRRPMRVSTVSLPEPQWERLRAESQVADISQSEIIRRALELRWALLALAQAQEAGHRTGVLWRRLLQTVRSSSPDDG